MSDSVKINVDQYLTLFEECDVARLDLIDGVIWIGGLTFDEFAEAYNVLRRSLT